MMNTHNRFKQHLVVTQPNITALDFLSQQTPLSRQQLKRAMQNGCVWHTGTGKPVRLRRAKKILAANTQIDIYYDPLIQQAISPKPHIIQSLEGYSIWYKPYGSYSQGTKWGDHCTIHRWIEIHHQPQQPAFIVHRLDKAASGLMLIAHSKRLAKQLSQLFADRAIDKTYQVIVKGKFPNTVQTYNANIHHQKALSQARYLEYSPSSDLSLVEVSIHTGRKHQIRIHLANAGFPILGDRLYGNASDTDINLQLVSVKLAFVCPVTNTQQSILLAEDLLPKISS